MHAHIKSKRLFYVLNLGFIDRDHAYRKSRSLRDAFKKIRKAKPGEVIRLEISFSMNGLFLFSKPMKTIATFNMKISRSYVQNVKHLLYVFKKLSIQFEKDQSNVGGNHALLNWMRKTTATSFATEDLFSNLINFYALADEGGSTDKILRKHGFLFKSEDQLYMTTAVWRYLLQTRTNHLKTKKFEPILIDQGRLNYFIQTRNTSTRESTFQKKLIKTLKRYDLIQDNSVKKISMPKYFKKYNFKPSEGPINIKDLKIVTTYN